MDVVYALKRQGRTLYGFGGWSVHPLQAQHYKPIGPFEDHHTNRKDKLTSNTPALLDRFSKIILFPGILVSVVAWE